MAEDVAAPARHRHHPGRLRRLAPGQLRLLRLARARPRHRPQRLRRGPPRRLGVGPAPAGGQHLGGRPAERRQRGAVRAAVRSLRRGLPRRGARTSPTSRCWRARTSGSTSTGCSREPREAAARTRSRGPPSGPATAPATVRCPGSPRQVDGQAPDRRGAAADHPAHRRRGRAARRGARRVPAHPGRRTGDGRWAATRIVDVAHKVVGVGSVGLRAYVALLEGSSPDDVVFLQLKQARRSVLARYVHGESAWHAHQGQRVVEYQQALQTVSDPLLGWTDGRRPAVLRAPVPQHEGHRRAVRRSTPRRSPTTRASSGTCWPRGTPAPAAPR